MVTSDKFQRAICGSISSSQDSSGEQAKAKTPRKSRCFEASEGLLITQGLDDRGLELNSVTREPARGFDDITSQNGGRDATGAAIAGNGASPIELARLIEVWSRLPDSTKNQILKLADQSWR